MANSNGWGDGSVNNSIGWGQGANNTIGWGKSHLDSWSGSTDIDGGNLPSNSVAPAITGTAQEGQTLTCSTGTWSGSPTYTYQWKRNGSNITSATSSTYTLVLADVGQSIKCTVTATNFVGSATADSNTVTPTSSVDADAQAFITAASITDPTQQSAINQLVVDLKGYGVWTKMKALYPFVGGTASTHKWNLKDPRDLDAAFRLVFNGGWTHNSNGATPNGTNGYADTKFNTFTNFGSNYAHQSVYLRNNTNSLILNGIIDVNGNRFDYGYDVNKAPFHAIASTSSSAGTDTRTDGFIISFRTGNTTGKYKRNNVDKITTLPSFTLNPNYNYYLGARNQAGSFQLPNVQEIAFSSIGDSLTDTEAANFYTAVQTFQTTLSRNV